MTETSSRRPSSRRPADRRTAAGRWALAALALVLIAALSLQIRFPGLSRATRHQLLAGGVEESWNIARSLMYWADYLGRLRVNPETQQVDFVAARSVATSPATVARLAFHDGDYGAAVAGFETLLADGSTTGDDLLWLGLAQLRRSEEQGCLGSLRGDLAASCALPLPARDHQHQAAEAAATFERRLGESSRDRDLIRWLRLLAKLASGTPADRLTDAERIDGPLMDLFYGEVGPDLLASSAGLRLVDHAQELGLDTFDAGKGVAVEDFDGDGDFDVVTGGSFDPLRYYENRVGEPDGRFVERSADAGFEGIVQPHIVTTADFDSDGRMDLFVGSLLQTDRLLHNVGGGRFVDVTQEVGLGDPPGEHSFSWTSAWSDVDLDGDLDLFVARWGIRAPGVDGILATERSDSRLFLWNGERFEDATEPLELGPFVSDAALLGAAFGDGDGDGDPDLFLSSPTRRGSVLLRNDGGSFTLAQRFDTGFGAAFVDFDHDGRLEILQTGLSDARTSVQAAVYGRQIGAATTGRTRLLRRLEDDSWSDVDDFLGRELPIGTMGSSYGDLDNDGCYEIYLGTGSPEPWFQLPNLLYLGRRDGDACRLRADNASMIQSFGSIQKGHGVVFFDFDGDGDQDVISSLGGMWPGDRWPNQLFVNESPGVGHWLELRLRGRQSNRHGLGAAIRVVARRPDGAEVVRTATIDGKTGFGSGPLVARFGLGEASSVDLVEVRWPVSDCLASYRVEIDSRAVLDESVCRSRGAGQGPPS